MHETSKALLCTRHPPARVRQISGFAKISACVFYKGCGFHAYDYAAKSAAYVPTQIQTAVGTISAA